MILLPAILIEPTKVIVAEADLDQRHVRHGVSSHA
jgi:hypothetical protein